MPMLYALEMVILRFQVWILLQSLDGPVFGSTKFKSYTLYMYPLICLHPIGIFNHVIFISLFPLFQWHACKLAILKLRAWPRYY